MRYHTPETRKHDTELSARRPSFSSVTFGALEIQTWTEQIAEADRYFIRAYRGKASKPLLYVWSRTPEGIVESIDQLVRNEEARLEVLATRKATKREPSQAAQAAAMLKADLAKAFPATKFSVRSEYFSNGNAVRVSWELGPTYQQVEEIAGKYRDGDFDGMTDSYNYREDQKVVTECGQLITLPRAKYVSVNREVPREVLIEAARQLCEFEGVTYEGPHTRLDDTDAHTQAHRVLSLCELPQGFTQISRREGVTVGSGRHGLASFYFAK